MLTWNKNIRKDQAGTVVSEGYKAQVLQWGEASVHPCIHHPGEMFLDCPAMGIEMHPLGKTDAIDALNPAEMVMLQTLKEYAVRCLEAMVIIGNPEG